MTRALSLAMLVFGSMLVACENPKPTAEPAPEAPRELTARDRAAYLQAEIGIVNGLERATTTALREVEDTGSEVSKAPPAELVTDGTRKLTVLFGGNNHAERNDCGCRKNPLGGLGRRHTMLAALEGPDAAEIWGAAGPAIGPVFHLDAGDAFFANNTADRGAPDAQKVAKYDAESVARALDTFSLDAVLVGEHDLVFGADHLRSITAKAAYALVSSNVRTADGQLAFRPSVVVERGGVKLAVVGVTKKDTRREKYYEERGLTVDAPLDAAKREIAALGERDAVVLLSNLGLPDTHALVAELKKSGHPVHLALVSGTTRMTSDPEFSLGVPVMEPLSRGKYLGRADLWLNGDELAYRNSTVATPSALRDYRRAVRSYWTTRKQYLRDRLKLVELEMSLETLETSQQADAGAVVGELKKRRAGTVDTQKKRLETMESRLENTWKEMLQSIVNTTPIGSEPVGDDWIAGVVVPVKIETTPHPATRKVLDPREKKRPEPAGRVVVEH